MSWSSPFATIGIAKEPPCYRPKPAWNVYGTYPNGMSDVTILEMRQTPMAPGKIELKNTGKLFVPFRAALLEEDAAKAAKAAAAAEAAAPRRPGADGSRPCSEGSSLRS